MRAWLVLLAILAACKPEDQRTGSVEKEAVREARTTLPGAMVAQLDSGNAAYRAKDYRRAVQHYRAAARIDGERAAPWFGIYMAERAAGNAAAADSALKRAQKIAPGATLIHPPPKPEGERQ